MYFLKTNNKIADYKIDKKELSEIKYIPFKDFEKTIETKEPTVTFTKQNYLGKLLEELKRRI